ncbi:SKP1-like protein 1 [Amaranthus tricolor]|uniref:SKP1-like protein 1 n=1 Tax=Amaranthus tricolor TaxID=29722 RepID=UPI00258560DB|nr:SKP1-like protein 1 [Amaranthus tricolor]
MKTALRIKSSEGDIWEVEHSVALQMGAYNRLINDNVLDLPNVNRDILLKVIEYCKMHAGDCHPDGHKIWDQDFVKNVSVDTLFDLIKAANDMDIRSLIDLTCQTMADYIKFMDVEKVREMFWEVNDFTPQEEEKLRKQHRWAFDFQ